LTARHALVTPIRWRDFPTEGAIRASFVLQPTRPFDSAILAFEPDHPTAQKALAALVARMRMQSSAPDGYVTRVFQTKSNVVVFWENPKAAPASRAAVLGCLS